VHGFLERINRGGSCVSIGSMAGAVPALYRTVYSPSKFALRGMWAGLRLELGESTGVYFTHVLPGYIITDMHGESLTSFLWVIDQVSKFFSRSRIHWLCEASQLGFLDEEGRCECYYFERNRERR
jgi:short-subunit dehydrogenase